MVKLQERNKGIIARILGLIEHFRQNGDIDRAEKAKSLLKKVRQQDFYIAFCGHFSSGKSTMINALLGSRVLPSSPIPTSANLVKIKSGAEDYAIVYEKGEAPLFFHAPYDFKVVKNYCKKGHIKEIEISMPDSNLPKGLTVMDTPGVDSTDDAHRIATESAIYLADLVFYVMDYNHVQSELNFTFTKELLDHGLELYLIVNQIDKHREEELPFSSFRKGVENAFASWHVHPRGIFYTSLKDLRHPHNGFGELKELISRAVSEKDARLERSVEASLRVLEAEHAVWLEEQVMQQKEKYVAVAEKYPDMDKEKTFQAEQRWLEEERALSSRLEKWEADAHRSLQALLQNAYLMPFETREKARLYLESMQKDFQVGFFAKKKKREEVRKQRLQDFYAALKSSVEAQIDWHLRSLAQSALKTLGLARSHPFEQEASALSADFSETLLAGQVKEGARITGDAILHYCDNVSEQIKRLARKAWENWQARVLEEAGKETAEQLEKLRREAAPLRELADAYRGLEKIKMELAEKRNSLNAPALHPEQLLAEIEQEWGQEKTHYRVYRGEREAETAAGSGTGAGKTVSESWEQAAVLPSDTVLAKMEQAIDLLGNKQGFKRYTENLRNKSMRLKHRRYTVALFGAFSAGKSSFANALIGEKTLPVSPNPTTAAICRICPPEAEHPHGTAAVQLKTEAQMLEDLQKSLSVFELSCNSFDEALVQIDKIWPSKTEKAKEKVHLSFLHAFRKGYTRFQTQLGMKLKTGMETFRQFVANEAQSCFVESIDLYYDCPLTSMGITLVDTPGADSINVRHTGVAFEYIKDSDAVFFVTYYNHAFARADREFLIQLGRVKDAFELDKMFFIVNAIDLASSGEEYKEVMAYVESQLLHFGIRNPRLYGVSSLLALEGQPEKSQLPAFEAGFRQFLDRELLNMVLLSAQSELDRGLQMVDAVIADANESKEMKKVKREQLKQLSQQAAALLEETNPSVLLESAAQEQKELLYYVKQRVFYRFPDFFKEAFNPAVIKSSRDLRGALVELAGSLGYDLAQEMRATTVRLEAHCKQLIASINQEWNVQIKNLLDDLSISAFEAAAHETPEFLPAFHEADLKPLEKTFRHFKNAKSFFEKNEKADMQDELQAMFEPLAQNYLEVQGEKLSASFRAWLEREFSRMISEAKLDINEQFAARLEALKESVDVDEWVEIRKKLA
ncbi:hypothetical protein BpJC7_20640 [Weizmannia acidilactici]|uniref:Dynamin N-terminal domain-containing protein n=1 Tax=Weizmannia acidilactici TaxID=2607726 RepID=A0A5J4JGE4_9BACI|nr:dynamin family protein [Weizmannia acidilactici]GER67873.1 hypothetical protein BpJC4_23440 [Weizmannia acidilactici]GER70761.1 hypothetical protein BpJC7_20640 [Weizmannia acidilactici]GER73716.1 hypothetical protein BpPP18_17830 [Weizmannia acidilactici]